MLENLPVTAASLMVVVLGLVQWIKQTFTVSGRFVRGISMVVGVVLGILYQLSLAKVTSMGEWFGIVIFGIGVGIAASGVYDVNKETQLLVVSQLFPEARGSALTPAGLEELKRSKR